MRAVKEFVRSIVDENTEATLLPLPAFPPPDSMPHRPRTLD